MIYNAQKQIELPFGEGNLYFKILFDAIYEVDKDFVSYQINDSSYSGTVSTDIQNHVERVFAYELYRQWADLLKDNGIKNLVLNGEVSKKIKEEFEPVSHLDGTNGETHSVFPDLVLHTSQTNDNEQIMICEIKRETKNEKAILYDFCKLYRYTKQEGKPFVWAKNFEYGIFIIYGTSVSIEELKNIPNIQTGFWNYVRRIDTQLKDTNNISKIVCITYDGTTLEYDTLDNICPELKQNINESNPDNANRNS